MRRPESDEYNAAYASYVDRVPETDVVAAMQQQTAETLAVFATIDEARAGHRYAPDKWSIRQLAGHIGDAERAFAYRLWAISRGDEQNLPGFDENPYVEHGQYDAWTFAEAVECFATLRRSSLLMVKNLPAAAWDRRGRANGWPITARALAYCMVGHERHHLAILRERYLAG
ncbi:MAG TPA: DinB family protein [Thermoanaerobaculia bacterium]|jgi:hypothetical protein